jgi:integrase/recombinase XerD
MQMLPLSRYLEEIKPQLHPKGEELNPGDIKNLLSQMMPELPGINPMIRNALHMRSSVTLHWLTQYNKREVQCRAGHKYISSTEKYVQQEMGNLTDQLAKYHPFG